MIDFQNISKRYGAIYALQQLSATFLPGHTISLIGPNGSGKTTLIKALLGLITPDQGAIYVDQKNIQGDHSYRNKIGYMPQISRFPDNLTVGHLFSLMKDIRNIHDSLLDPELIHAYKLESLYHQKLQGLSGGTRQKVSAALAFLFDPMILVLDEPTAGLDPASSEILKEKIKHAQSKNKTILITSHILSDLDEITTDILYLQDGKPVFYKPLAEIYDITGIYQLSKALSRYLNPGRPSNLITI